MKKLLKVVEVIMVLCMVLCIGTTMRVQAATTQLSVNQVYTEDLEAWETKLYQFKITQAGYFNVTIQNTNPIGNQRVAASVYDANNAKVINEYYGSNFSLPVYASNANQTFYLKVRDDYCANETSFRIKIDFHAANNWETENNNTTKQADAITAKKTYYGTISDNDEYDYFKFTVKQNSKVKIKFGAAEVDGQNYRWKVDILNKKNLSNTIYIGNVTDTYICYLKKGTYYLRVKNDYGANNIKYRISYTVSKLNLKTPKITSISGQAHKGWFDPNYVCLSSIKIKNSGDCTGYTVRVAKKSNMKGILAKEDIDFGSSASKSKVSLPNKLNVLKKYYVQVRGYVKDPFGNCIYGSYSKTKCKTVKNSTYNEFKN